jgi:type I restriction enzyme S subunit
MELREYPQWKETGIDWLAQLPEHWELNKFRFMFKLGRGLGITKSNLIDEGVACVNYGEIHSKFGFEVAPEKHDLKCVPEDYLESSPNALLEQGDFVYADTSEDIEGSGNFTHLNSSTPTFAGYHTVTAKPLTNNHSKFLAYLFHSELFRFQIRKSVSGVKVFSVTQDILKSCYVWLPPTTEQTQIAKFLDYKTAQIDRLIEKKKALIEKLNEQRIAMITQAVTKGLNPDAPMKDSEVDWLGEVPEHWGITKFRYLFSFGRGLGITKSDLKDEGIPCLNYGEIHSKYGFEVIPEKHPLKCVPEAYLQEGQASLLKSGDFVFADTSEDIEGSGNFSYLNSDTPTFAGYHTVIARLESNDIPRFLAYQLDSIMYRYQIRKAVTGVKVFSITQQILKSCYVWLPPVKEQIDIVDYLDGQLGAIDQMLQVNNKTIDKLNEYRTSLITAAVTGKIDVREVNVPAGF